MREIAPGLFHWTAPHPGWDPEGEPGSAADWPEQVGCTLYATEKTAVFIDPQVPDALWPALDALVAGRPVVVLTTIRFHGRSRDAVLERYGGDGASRPPRVSRRSRSRASGRRCTGCRSRARSCPATC